MEKLNERDQCGPRRSTRSRLRLADLGGVPRCPVSPADFGKLIADETEKWGKVIQHGEHQAGVITCPTFHKSRYANGGRFARADEVNVGGDATRAGAGPGSARMTCYRPARTGVRTTYGRNQRNGQNPIRKRDEKSARGIGIS